MQSVADPKPDRAPEVVPEIRHTVPWRVVSVTALSERRLKVAFADGTQGEVDLNQFLADPKVEGTVFEALREADFFTRVDVRMGAVQWPNGADLAPDAMYDAIRQDGRWIV
ncbi:MAG: DUF2442 domain-containing protein [Desulfurellaceae bacterium]|nr:DUF2442 domain-containing protein [Desulfurellaceae bacterium]